MIAPVFLRINMKRSRLYTPKEAETMMKLRILIGAILLCAIMSIPAVAQQDPNDQGAADSVFMLIKHPSVTGDLGLAEVSLYFLHDEQNVVAASAGFSWDNPNWLMDSAVWSPQADTTFNLFKSEYYNNSLDSTNAYQRFQCVGLLVSGDGMPTAADPQMIITYYFHHVGPDTSGSLCIALEDYILLLFVDPANNEYEPIWRGDVCSPDTRISIIENPLNGHTYEFVKLRGFVSWHTAREMAENQGGYLATITDSIEADIVRRLLAYPGDEAWLGGTDSVQEGTWKWITGEPWNYTNWYPGEPNASQPDEDYLLAQHILGGRWVDVFDDNSGYIVERDNVQPVDTLINLTQWPVSEGGNGHWYAVIPQGLNWWQADSIAGSFEIGSASGHLATVRSAEENAFITNHILPGVWPEFALTSEYWLGGQQLFANWKWVTGEPFIYTNWADGEPNGTTGVEPVLAIIGHGWDVNPPLPGQWVSRLPECGYGGYPCRWAVVEFDTPGQEPPLLNLSYWPESEGGNGHWYALLLGPSTWSEANRYAATLLKDGMPGHLATATSMEENYFILQNVMHWPVWDTVIVDSLVPWVAQAWMGGYQTNPGFWNWITDEPFDYTNWGFGHPVDSTPEFVLAMQGGSGYVIPENPSPGEWLSVDPVCYLDCINCCASIVEFDTNSTHPPRTLYVPQEFPTIQMAIDSAQHYDKVLVSPGTYHESLNFKGKAIEVISTGGPLVTTITNNRTADLVTFNQGEGPRTKLDGFTLRGGWMAILCVGSGPTISHNICVDQNVWNWSAIALAGMIERSTEANGDPLYHPDIGPAPATLINNTIVNSANGGISSFSSEPPTIKNNIVAFNTAYGIHQQSPHSQPQPNMGYNDFYGNPHGNYNITDFGPGAISADPLFANDFSLDSLSPCINTGDPDPRFNDPDGSRNDMGAVYYREGPGGGVIPTNEWIVVFCSGLPIWMPMGPGDWVTAYDPDGVLCGAVQRSPGDGSFGFMAIYRDDPYTNLDEGAEPGDLIQFAINGQMMQSDPIVYWTTNGDIYEVCNFASEMCLDIPLHSGWNLISWNANFHDDIYSAFGSIMGCLDVVLSFEEGALVFDPGLDPFNTLTHVDPHHGYWVRVNCDTALQICGEPLQQWEAIYCEPGWNLVSYWPPEPLLVEDALISILPHLQQVMGFDQTAQVWMTGMGQFNTLTEMRPTFGYWAKVDTWLPLIYPGFFPMDCTSTDIVVRDRNDGASSGGIETSRTWMSVYGDDISVDGQSLTEGTRIVFKIGEAVCGEGFYTDGKLKLTPVYGYDASGEVSKLYPGENDVISVFINDQQVYPDLSWTGDGARVRLAALSTDAVGLPQTFALKQNYPNPFNPSTNIAFELPSNGHVSLAIYNVLGQKVATITDQLYPAGRWEVTWNGNDDSGDQVATGIYFYRLTMGDNVLTRKMMLLK
ncbi:MAG: T9SS type A sorting domain-containing protein [candidate division Zixibacteria bacterium]|nr:T9SS type A sorting domain-containing protein [candidate division Zixibacteria bacterium]